MHDPAEPAPAGSPSIAVVTLPEEIDLGNADSVTSGLQKALASGATIVIADMTSTTFTDTSGIRALVLFHKSAAAKNAELRLATSSPTVLRTLSILRLDTCLPIYPTVAKARAADTTAA